jgi:predicted  nucleic acid-binding Zn-ribbon protein
MFGRVSDLVESKFSQVSDGVLDYRAKLKKKADDDKRIADEAARKAEAKQKDELKKQADKLEMQGHDQAADSLRDAARAIVAPVAQTQVFENTVEAGDGSVGGRGKIEVTIDDDDSLKLEFIKAIANGMYPIYLVKLDVSEIKGYAKKNKLFGRNVMPGITVVKKESLIVKV